MDDSYTCYMIVNCDLKMSAGKIASQCGHAVSLLIRRLNRTKPTYYKKWSITGEKMIVLRGNGRLIDRLISEYYLFNSKSSNNETWCLSVADAGNTQVKSGSITVIIFNPLLAFKCPIEIEQLKLL